MKIGCIVMAAGNARRFGSNKLDARVEGKTLLRRALEAVPAACFDRVAVVTQYPQGMELAREMGFLPVENSRPDLGLSHTIALGMAHMQDMDGVMFQVSDQPLLRRDSVERLVEAFRRHPDRRPGKSLPVSGQPVSGADGSGGRPRRQRRDPPSSGPAAAGGGPAPGAYRRGHPPGVGGPHRRKMPIIFAPSGPDGAKSYIL